MTDSAVQKIFVNLPVRSLERSIAFYQAIGGRKVEAFSDDTAAGIAFDDRIHVMLLTHDKFRCFTSRSVADAHQTSEVLVCLSCASRGDVDATVAAGVEAGGEADPAPVQDHGFMYGRGLADPDGHIWEFMWMDLSAFPTAGGSDADASKT